MSLESFLISQRIYCEVPDCLDKAKVCRQIDGHNKVFCWQHDPITIEDFDSWLKSNSDTIGDAQDFSEYLAQREDSI